MKKVLLVDDREENLYLLSTLLKGNGYEVASAMNGAEALVQAHKSPPDMIVADVLMPVMDGFELCHKVKTDKELKDSAFIFYTASYLDKRDEELALSLGVDRYLLKPQEPDILLKVLGEVFDERDSKAGAGVIPFPEERDYLKDHNESLVRMLEKKIEQLNHTQQGLKKEIQTRKVAEEKLKTSLLEKEALLKEVYHRTKNNMQVIVGLFDLQARKLGLQSPETVFREMSDRIYSMSMVHDLLYRSKNLYEIKLDQYLSSLTDRLLALYNSNETEVELDLQIEPVPINIQFAVPLGLVITEVLSNALKYAFKDRAVGLISIVAKQTGENGLHLVLRDNGIGLRLNTTNQNTLGMHIIQTVVKNQLSGTIEIDDSNGLSYSFSLPDILLKD